MGNFVVAVVVFCSSYKLVFFAIGFILALLAPGLDGRV